MCALGCTMKKEYKVRNLTLNNIAEAVEGELKCESGSSSAANECTAVVIDSRKIEPGALFVATRGERVDGHNFIAQVFEAGALGVICERVPEGISGPCIVVKDSFVALKKLAAYYRKVMCDVKIVGIVGSVGKTSTKELVASVLGEHFCTLKTEGNFNNEIGVPLTLLRLRDEHEAAVVEMGISDFGEMNRLGEMVCPDGVVMTNIGPCHLEKLIDLDGVLRAKSEVFPHIRKGGFLVLNGEDEKLNTVKSFGDLEIMRFGRKVQSDGSAAKNAGCASCAELSVYTDNVKSRGLEGSDMNITVDGKCFETSVPLPGGHMVMNSLAATAVGLRFGLSLEEIDRGIRAVKPVAGRSNLIKTDRYLIVDDCYNANPKSMKAAIDLMGDALGRKVAILGDMFELGDDAAALHGEVGEYAATHGIDLLVCVGELSKNMYDRALASGMKSGAGTGLSGDVRYFATRDELLRNIGQMGLRHGDTILVKASHGMGFDEVILALYKGSV